MPYTNDRSGVVEMLRALFVIVLIIGAIMAGSWYHQNRQVIAIVCGINPDGDKRVVTTEGVYNTTDAIRGMLVPGTPYLMTVNDRHTPLPWDVYANLNQAEAFSPKPLSQAARTINLAGCVSK